MALDKKTMQAIRIDIDAALAEVAKKHGLRKLRCGNGSFSTDSFTMKVEGVADGGESKEALTYKAYSRILGLPDFGTVVKLDKGEMAIVGMRIGGPYKSVKLRRLSDNASFKIQAGALKSILIRQGDI